MEEKMVLFEQKGYVGIVTINRPRQYNAFNSAVLKELEAIVDGIDCDRVRCAILTGAGEKAFVAGADIGEMSRMTREEAKAFGKYGNRVMRKVETLPMPVIAAVNGIALGGGCELAMACDIRLASENAVFGQPEVGLGITAGWGGTQRLAKLAGPGYARELLYTAEKIDAQTALNWRLVNAVYPAEQLMDEALKLAERICKQAPIAVRMSKQAINRGVHIELEEFLADESEFFSACFGTNDQRNAMQAFLEKRKPEPFENK
jgi:enoyl-CoA hydratase